MLLKPVAFISAPYTHTDPQIMDTRFNQFLDFCAKVELDGKYHVTSSLFNVVVARRHKLPDDFEFWGSHSISLLDKCDVMIIATHIEGWHFSRGVLGELKYALDTHKLILDENYGIPYEGFYGKIQKLMEN